MLRQCSLPLHERSWIVGISVPLLSVLRSSFFWASRRKNIDFRRAGGVLLCLSELASVWYIEMFNQLKKRMHENVSEVIFSLYDHQKLISKNHDIKLFIGNCKLLKFVSISFDILAHTPIIPNKTKIYLYSFLFGLIYKVILFHICFLLHLFLLIG